MTCLMEDVSNTALTNNSQLCIFGMMIFERKHFYFKCVFIFLH